MSGRKLISKSFNLGSSYAGVMTMHAPVVIACICSCSIQQPSKSSGHHFFGFETRMQTQCKFFLFELFQRSLLKLFLILPTPESVV